jgi:hypothetical protein
MLATSAECEIHWDDLTLSQAQVVTLHIRARTPAGQNLDFTYDHGSVLLSAGGPASRSPSTRVLNWREVALFLAALRTRARNLPRSRAVDSSAVHAFVSTLAKLVHSPGPIPFSTAAFANIQRLDTGELVGEIALDGDVVATIRYVSGNLYYEQHSLTRPKGARRLLTIAQLRALIQALRMQIPIARPGINPLWRELLAAASKKDESLRNSGL